jgi:hypothetical protein
MGSCDLAEAYVMSIESGEGMGMFYAKVSSASQAWTSPLTNWIDTLAKTMLSFLFKSACRRERMGWQ